MANNYGSWNPTEIEDIEASICCVNGAHHNDVYQVFIRRIGFNFGKKIGGSWSPELAEKILVDHVANRKQWSDPLAGL